MTYVKGLIGFAALLGIAILALAALGYFTGGLRRPEIILTIVLIVGVIALIAALAGLLALLRNFGLAAATEALGLPPGSIRAILALMLVLIFAMTSIFIYYNVANGGTRSLGLTEAQLQLLPQDQITGIQLRPQPTPPETPGPQLFDVTLRSSPEGTQLGQQLVTLIGTLVTAVAAFYFGSNSVVTAIKAQTPRTDAPLDAKAAKAKAAASQAAADAAALQAKRDAAVAAALEGGDTKPEATTPDPNDPTLKSPPALDQTTPPAPPSPEAPPDLEIREGP